MEISEIQNVLHQNFVFCRQLPNNLYKNEKYNMEASEIKFKTIKHYLNGVKYLSQKQVEDLCHIVCYDLKIEKSEENFNHIKDACRVYFTLPLSVF